MSFMGVIGSKASVAKELIAMMPPEAFGECYIELFLGGGGVFFAKKAARINILNDADPDLAVTFEAIQRNHKAVEKDLRVLLDDEETFRRVCQLRQSEEWHNEPAARRAAMVIFIHKASYNSNQVALASSSKSRSSFNSDLDLTEFAEKLKRAQIRCFDWRTCIDKYLYGPTPVEAFVLADPPYVVADRAKHYRINFHAVEHVRFWHRMTRLTKDNGPGRNVKVMITYDDDPLIRALYREADGWRTQPLLINYAAAHDSGQPRSELVITNYDVQEATGSNSSEDDSNADWSDVPHERVTLHDTPFDDLPCCKKEVFALLVQGLRKGICRVCNRKVTRKEL